MTVGELKNLVANFDDEAIVLTSGVEVAQAVKSDDPALILEMDPEYQHPGLVIWRGPDHQRH
jgi:hypothetical protein